LRREIKLRGALGYIADGVGLNYYFVQEELYAAISALFQ
jgi:hypothetical protein